MDSFVSNATNFFPYFILFFDNCLSVIKNDIHLFSPKLFTYPSIQGRFVPNGIIFFITCQANKVFKIIVTATKLVRYDYCFQYLHYLY